MKNTSASVVHYHLPGLFEFYELYRLFLPLFYAHREYFYDWCDIGSIYGAPSDCLWGGGRAAFGNASVKDVIALVNEYNISARLTFSNSLLTKEHLADTQCNALCKMFQHTKNASGVIVHSDLLAEHLKNNFPSLYLVSSTTKVLTDFESLNTELNRQDFSLQAKTYNRQKHSVHDNDAQQHLHQDFYGLHFRNKPYVLCM